MHIKSGAVCRAAVPHVTHCLALAARQLHPPVVRACPLENAVRTALPHSSSASPDRSSQHACRITVVPDLQFCGRICRAAAVQMVQKPCPNACVAQQRSSDGQIGVVRVQRGCATVTAAQPRDDGPAAA
jgi:hypothetical protein